MPPAAAGSASSSAAPRYGGYQVFRRRQAPRALPRVVRGAAVPFPEVFRVPRDAMGRDGRLPLALRVRRVEWSSDGDPQTAAGGRRPRPRRRPGPARPHGARVDPHPDGGPPLARPRRPLPGRGPLSPPALPPPPPAGRAPLVRPPRPRLRRQHVRQLLLDLRGHRRLRHGGPDQRPHGPSGRGAGASSSSGPSSPGPSPGRCAPTSSPMCALAAVHRPLARRPRWSSPASVPLAVAAAAAGPGGGARSPGRPGGETRRRGPSPSAGWCWSLSRRVELAGQIFPAGGGAAPSSLPPFGFAAVLVAMGAPSPAASGGSTTSSTGCA